MKKYIMLLSLILILSGCDDEKSKDSDHNHKYSSDTSVNTEKETGTPTEKAIAGAVGSAVVPERAAPSEPEKEAKFTDASPVRMAPSGETCIPLTIDSEDTDNFKYGLYCNENGANVWHEGVPESLLSIVDSPRAPK